MIEEKPKKPRKPRRISVRVVGKYGKGVIIERAVSGGLVRAIAPPETLEHQEERTLILKSDLDACIPYGVDWEKHLEITVTPEAVAKMLRKRGVWTVEDFEKLFVQARQGALGMISQDLIRMLQSAQKEATK